MLMHLGAAVDFAGIMNVVREHDYSMSSTVAVDVVARLIRNPSAANMKLLLELWTYADTDLLLLIHKLMILTEPNKSWVLAILQLPLPGAPIQPMPRVLLRDNLSSVMDPNALAEGNSNVPIDRMSLWAQMCLRCAVLLFERLSLSLLGFLQDIDTNSVQILLLLAQLNQHSQEIVQTHIDVIRASQPLCNLFWNSWPTTLALTTQEEFMDVLTLTRFVFMGTATPPPLSFLLQLIAGKTPVRTTTLRLEALSLLRKLPMDVLVTQSSACKDPRLVLHLSRILREPQLSAYDRTSVLMMLSHLEFILDIDFDLDNEEPFMYEQTLHVMLSMGQTDQGISAPMRNMTIMLACKLFQRLALAYPRRNFIESVYHAFAATVAAAQLTPMQQLTLRTSLHAALVTPGHREVMMELLSLDDDPASPWLRIFPRAFVPTPVPGPPLLDGITYEAQRRLFKFAVTDTQAVGLETMIHHFVNNGMTNPFTNLPCTWPLVAAANNDWSLQP
jgi:hypothetical protein